jgi:hypothetical protein
MTEPMDSEARRLLTVFARVLNRLDPQPLDWQRFYEFTLYAFRHSPQAPEAVGHALVQDGLDWEEAEGFVLFYTHAIELLEREAATTSVPGATRAKRRVSSAGRKPGARKGR